MYDATFPLFSSTAALAVIGGGMTGLTAAVEAAECGISTHLVEILPRLGGRVRSLASYFPKLSPMITNTLDDTFPEDSFDNLTAFILQLSTQYHSMRGLTLYKIYEKWVHSFGPATALVIDYLGYHLYTIAMVLLESPFISRNVLEPILEKSHGASIYRSMQMILGGK